MLRRRQTEQPVEAASQAQESSRAHESKEQRHLRRRQIRKSCHVQMKFAFGYSPGGADENMVMETFKMRGRLLDLSDNGACVFGPNEVAPGQEVNLRIDLQGRSTITPRAQVCWTKPVPEKEGYACGVKFFPLSSGDKKHLDAFIKVLDKQLADEA
jgi:c-di-GMP-binding flagellar brake protein YcgR